MERLTNVGSSGEIWITDNDETRKFGCKESAYKKLAEFEDFEEIFREKMTDVVCDILGDKEEFGKWLERNQWIAKKCDEYARAEEQGLLVKLPCKVGDTAWYVDNDDDNYPIEIRITGIEIKENYIHYYAEEKEDCGTLEFDSDDFDKTIFFTREEAFSGLKDALSELNDTLRKQIGKLDELEEYNNAMDDYIDFINN